MAVYKDSTFRNVTINLDDNTFDGCTIEDCTLVYSGGSLPRLLNSSFINSGFTLAGPAQRTLVFMQMLVAAGAKNVVEEMIKAIMQPQPDERAS